MFSVHWATAQIINVPEDQPTIQAGIDAAVNGNTVLVAPGTYAENINFKGKAIIVASHFINSGDTNDINNTIINGSPTAHPDSGSIVYFINGEDTNSVLNGFTITGGSGTFLTTFQIRGGGGILALDAGCKIINNKIMDNHIDYTIANAGGVQCLGISGVYWAVIGNNIIKYNSTTASGFSAGSGGISFSMNGIIRNNVIEYNTCTNTGEQADGGGIELELVTAITEPVIINNNIIRYNVLNGTTAAVGAGINSAQAPAVITNNIIHHNEAHSTGASHGGGIFINMAGEGTLLQGNTINNNYVEGVETWGAGVRLRRVTNPVVLNNEISHNILSGTDYAFGAGLILNHPYGSAQVSGNVMRNNTAIGYSCGGGSSIYDAENVKVIFEKNLVEENSVDHGGGIYIYKSFNTVIRNNLINKNSVDGYGGAILFWSGADGKLKGGDRSALSGERGYHQIVVNNTFFDNEASGGGAIYSNYETETPVFFNNIFWNNYAFNEHDIFNESSAILTITYNDIDTTEVNGSWTGQGNILTDPFFWDSLCHLDYPSHCIGAGTESILVDDSTYFCPPDDFDGEARPQCGKIDIGADESPFGVGVDELRVAGCGLQVHPNPTSGTACLRYLIRDPGYLISDLYTIGGERICELVRQYVNQGTYEIQFDFSNLPDGVYFVRLKAGEESAVQKVIVQ